MLPPSHWRIVREGDISPPGTRPFTFLRYTGVGFLPLPILRSTGPPSGKSYANCRELWALSGRGQVGNNQRQLSVIKHISVSVVSIGTQGLYFS